MPIEFQPLRLVSATDSVAPPARVRTEQPAAKPTSDIEVSLSSLLGTTTAPPIDHERIVALRAAIENGTYGLAPDKVAAAMIETFKHPASAR